MENYDFTEDFMIRWGIFLSSKSSLKPKKYTTQICSYNLSTLNINNQSNLFQDPCLDCKHRIFLRSFLSWWWECRLAHVEQTLLWKTSAKHLAGTGSESSEVGLVVLIHRVWGVKVELFKYGFSLVRFKFR